MGSWRRAEAATPPAPRTRLGLVAALAALVVLSLGVLYAGDSTPGAWDARIGTAAYDVGPSWRHVALALDFLGEPAGSAALVVAAVAGFLLLRRPRAAVLLVVAAALTVGTATLLKSLVGRTIHGDNLSYPSGHTAFATAVALVVALTAAGRSGLGRTAGLSLVLAAALVTGAAMGWAEVALGAHYPTDVLGGWCTALAVTPATALVVDRLGDRFGARPADRAADGPAETPADRTADTGRRVGR